MSLDIKDLYIYNKIMYPHFSEGIENFLYCKKSKIKAPLRNLTKRHDSATNRKKVPKHL